VDVRGSPDCGQVTWARRRENHAHNSLTIDLSESERNTSYTTTNPHLRKKKRKEERVCRKEMKEDAA
jgi:hypothetical protein